MARDRSRDASQCWVAPSCRTAPNPLEVEVEAILGLATAWHAGSSDEAQEGRPALVEQHAASEHAHSGAVWANDPVAAWRVDQHGSRQLTGEEARKERVAAADGDFTGPGMLCFAPVTGMTFPVKSPSGRPPCWLRRVDRDRSSWWDALRPSVVDELSTPALIGQGWCEQVRRRRSVFPVDMRGHVRHGWTCWHHPRTPKSEAPM